MQTPNEVVIHTMLIERFKLKSPTSNDVKAFRDFLEMFESREIGANPESVSVSIPFNTLQNTTQNQMGPLETMMKNTFADPVAKIPIDVLRTGEPVALEGHVNEGI